MQSLASPEKVDQIIVVSEFIGASHDRKRIQRCFRTDEFDRLGVATIGYRQAASTRVAGYIGAGGGWLTVKEESPGFASTSKGHAQVHVGLGAEFMVVRGLWTAGEIQYRAVPKGLDPSGIGPVYKESDLGGTTFLFKILVGR